MKYLNNVGFSTFFWRVVMIFSVITYIALAIRSHLGLFGFFATSLFSIVGAYLLTRVDDKFAAIFNFTMLFALFLLGLEFVLAVVGLSLNFHRAGSNLLTNLIESVQILLLGVLFLKSTSVLNKNQPR